MKKYILSLSLIAIFGIYVFYQRNGVNAPIATTDNSAPVATQNLPISGGRGNPNKGSGNGMMVGNGMGMGMSAFYRDGTYTGSVADAYFVNLQVSATISAGKISDVAFLQYPNDRGTSIEINTQAMPMLKSEAIQSQNADVNIVSGATQTSVAFKESLASALAQARN